MTPEFDPADLAALSRPFPLILSGAKTLIAPNRIVYQPMEGNDADEKGGPSALTLRRYVEALGGQLEISVLINGDRVRIA